MLQEILTRLIFWCEEEGTIQELSRQQTSRANSNKVTGLTGSEEQAWWKVIGEYSNKLVLKLNSFFDVNSVELSALDCFERQVLGSGQERLGESSGLKLQLTIREFGASQPHNTLYIMFDCLVEYRTSYPEL